MRRKWKWLGKLVSEEGFTLAHGHKSITYTDARGSFEFGLEDGFLFSPPRKTKGAAAEALSATELEQIISRVIASLQTEGLSVQLFCK